ncbi:class D sortase [Thermobrachium celere]|nr:class D sortase [Thermobrachium celere]
MKRGVRHWTPLLLYALGLAILSYSFINMFFDRIVYLDLLFKKSKIESGVKSEKFKINGYLIDYPLWGDVIGKIEIKRLNISSVIYQGDDDEQLIKGVGHSFASLIPGEGGNCILAGHRDTVFRRLEGIRVGDEVVIYTTYGTYKYRVKNIKIVDKNDETVIVPSDKEMLTIYTCYPFNYIGAAPKRFVVTCDFVESTRDINLK